MTRVVRAVLSPIQTLSAAPHTHIHTPALTTSRGPAARAAPPGSRHTAHTPPSSTRSVPAAHYQASVLACARTHRRCGADWPRTYPHPHRRPVMAHVRQLARDRVRRVPAGHQHRHVHGRQGKDEVERPVTGPRPRVSTLHIHTLTSKGHARVDIVGALRLVIAHAAHQRRRLVRIAALLFLVLRLCTHRRVRPPPSAATHGGGAPLCHGPALTLGRRLPPPPAPRNAGAPPWPQPHCPRAPVQAPAASGSPERARPPRPRCHRRTL
jgi:hypothetical protein